MSLLPVPAAASCVPVAGLEPLRPRNPLPLKLLGSDVVSVVVVVVVAVAVGVDTYLILKVGVVLTLAMVVATCSHMVEC